MSTCLQIETEFTSDTIRKCHMCLFWQLNHTLYNWKEKYCNLLRLYRDSATMTD